MLEEGKISNLQLSILIITYTIGAAILTVPSVVTNAAQQDGWLSSILVLCFGLSEVLVIGYLAERHPDITLIQLNEKILGKWLGIALSFVFSMIFLLLTVIFLRVTGDLITTHILTETPIQAIEALFLLTVIGAVRVGLEPFARTSEMVFPYILIFILFSVLFLFPQTKIQNITPVFENGMMPILNGSIDVMSTPYSSLVIFLMLTPFVNKPKKIKRNLFYSTMAGGIIIIIITSLSILVLGADVTSRLNYSPYMLAQKIDIGNFIQRIEIIAGAFIFISLFIKTTICYYSMVLGFAQTFRLNDYKVLTLPFGLIVITLSIFLFPNIIYFHTVLTVVWSPLLFIIGFIIPLLLILVDWAKFKFLKRM